MGIELGTRLPPQALTRNEIQSLLYHSDRGSDAGAKRKAILTVLWQGGLRRRECCRLRYPEDVYPLADGKMILRIAEPKGFHRKENAAMPREIGLGDSAAATIRCWLKIRGEHAGPLFPTRSGIAMHPGAINKMVSQVAHRAGITRRCTPHSFRHTFACKLYTSGVDLVNIMLALGHTHLQTTQIYLRSINATGVQKITSAIDWDEAGE